MRSRGQSRASARWRRPFHHLTRLERHEITWLLLALGGAILLLAFFKLASEVMEGESLAFDTKLLRALRDPADPARLIVRGGCRVRSSISRRSAAPSSSDWWFLRSSAFSCCRRGIEPPCSCFSRPRVDGWSTTR
jgi:hypothetical protein